MNQVETSTCKPLRLFEGRVLLEIHSGVTVLKSFKDAGVITPWQTLGTLCVITTLGQLTSLSPLLLKKT